MGARNGPEVMMTVKINESKTTDKTIHPGSLELDCEISAKVLAHDCQIKEVPPITFRVTTKKENFPQEFVALKTFFRFRDG